MKTIFVSSTFTDIQYERNAIRDITAPLLNKEAKKYGETTDFCELYREIREISAEVIGAGDISAEENPIKESVVYPDEIDRSEPLMVVLLGFSYCQIPDSESIKTVADQKQLALEELERSVTALEIEYGAFCGKEKFNNTLFYFREIEGTALSDYISEDKEVAGDREYEEKLLTLKDRIKSITAGKVREYTLTWNGSGFDGVDAFALTLAEDIIAMLMPEWVEKEKLTSFQCERRAHAAFIREKNAMFRARQSEAEKLIKDALSQPVTIIRGIAGSGKSTLFSYMATELKNSGWTILPFISGLTAKSSSEMDIIENIVYFIEEKLHLDHYIDETDAKTGERQIHIPDEWGEKLTELCLAYTKTGAKLLIMIDAADKLSGEWGMLRFIPTSESEGIHLVITRTANPAIPAREGCYTLMQLDNEGKQVVLGGILARSGGEIPESIINAMFKPEVSNNPLYLSLLVQRLLMISREDFEDIRSMEDSEDIRNRGGNAATIEQYQTKLIKNQCPDDIDEMSAALLNEAGKQINEKLVSKVLQYLAVSRNGLRRKDFAVLLEREWSEGDFYHFVNYMHDCFLLRKDGRYDFTHDGVRTCLRSQCKDLEGVNREILEYLKSLKAKDSVRMKELAWHAIALDDKEAFIEHIIKYSYYSYELSNTVNDVYAQCLADKGEWIIDVLKETKKYDAGEELCRLADFCNDKLKDAFWTLEDTKKLEIKLRILTANIDFAEHLYHKFKSYRSRRTLSNSYENVAEIYEGLDGIDNQRHVLELYAKSLPIMEEIVEEPKEPNTYESRMSGLDRLHLLERYRKTAQMYEALGGEDNLKQALILHEKYLKIREQQAQEKNETANSFLSMSYAKVADMYVKLDGEDNLQCALKFYGKALSIDEQLAKERDFTQKNWEFFRNYDKIFDVFNKLGGKDNPQKTLTLYENELQNREKQAKERGTIVSKWMLSHSYNEAAQRYMKLGGSDNIQRALELYNKDLVIYELLAQEFGTAESQKELAGSYNRVAEMYVKLGGSDNIQRALELYNKDLAIYEQLAKELDTIKSQKELADRYYWVAKDYAKLDGSDTMRHGLELYSKAFAIYDELEKELSSSDKNELSFNYDEVAGIYEKLGGEDSLLCALKLYEKAISIREQLAEDILSSTKRKMELIPDYYKAARIYAILGGNDSLLHTLELYEKAMILREQLAKELDTAKSKGELSESYRKVAGIYEVLDSEDNLQHALKLYEKDIAVREVLVKEFDTAQNKRELSLSYHRSARIYEKLGGSDNLQLALSLYEKSLPIQEQLAKEPGSAQNKKDLSISYLKIDRLRALQSV
ncbi:MAG: DUF4062 domain-containing protein [Clostridiales bacterium]|nr:DUF4062 domain-containing protein [Clostridiales bacterium]